MGRYDVFILHFHDADFTFVQMEKSGPFAERLEHPSRRGFPSLDHLLRAMKTAMQETPVKLLDLVALLEDKLEERLVSGQIGTVVEVLAPDVFEVEFLDSQGRTVALTELKRPELLVLRHEPAQAL